MKDTSFSLRMDKSNIYFSQVIEKKLSPTKFDA